MQTLMMHSLPRRPALSAPTWLAAPRSERFVNRESAEIETVCRRQPSRPDQTQQWPGLAGRAVGRLRPIAFSAGAAYAFGEGLASRIAFSFSSSLISPDLISAPTMAPGAATSRGTGDAPTG